MTVISLRDHPANRDPIAALASPGGAAHVGWAVYKTRGGYVACLPNGRALPGYYPSLKAAQAAQRVQRAA